MDVKTVHEKTKVVVDQPQDVDENEALYKILKDLEAHFVTFVTLWYLGVEKDNLKLKLVSTTMLF